MKLGRRRHCDREAIDGYGDELNGLETIWTEQRKKAEAKAMEDRWFRKRDERRGEQADP